VLFRSDALHRLSRRDRSTLDIASVVDFRAPAERERAPDRLPGTVAYYSLPIDVGGDDLRRELRAVARGESVTVIADILVDIGRALVTDHTPVYRQWLAMLVGGARDAAAKDGAARTDRAAGLPHVFHCTAGKDRTGFAAAVLLRILGVSHAEVMEDYLASNRYLHRFVAATMRKVFFVTFSRAKARLVRPLLVADERYLAASFETIDDCYGSFDAYVRDGLSLSDDDVALLREYFLE
jgi:protein-tyrosine phosphatase